MEVIQGEKFRFLADNSRIFYCHTHEVNELFKREFSDEFILISHNSDGKVMENGSSFPHADSNSMPSKLKYWFAQNVCVSDERIISLPLGLENSYNFPHLMKINKMISKLNEPKSVKNLAYMNHNVQTNPKEREFLYDHFNGVGYITIERGVNGTGFEGYLDNIYNHRFVFCPEGNGTDTHRTWECLYMGSIPIEKRNINNSYYTDLPICFVDSWEEITEDFLIKEYDRITSTTWNLEKMDFNYWKNKILSL